MNIDTAQVAQESPVSSGLSQLQRIRDWAREGESDLATIEAIRLNYRCAQYLEQPATAESEDIRALLAVVLSDLAVMRFGVNDRDASLGCLKAAAQLYPGDPLIEANLHDVQSAISTLGGTTRQYAGVPLSVDGLSPWVVNALDQAERLVGLQGKDVFEIGGATPMAGAQQMKVRSWTAFDLRAPERSEGDWYKSRASNAEQLPVPNESFDVGFSCCAFEHFSQLQSVLDEAARVLRPGGMLFSQFRPIWSFHQGHHLFLDGNTDHTLCFQDPVVPAWSHLFLAEEELQYFLGYGLGAEKARRAAHWIHHSPYCNRLLEGDYQRIFAASPLTIAHLRPWGVKPPAPQLQKALLKAHPGGGNFGAAGLQVVFVKDAQAS